MSDSKLLIKICGVTNVADALLSADAGADMLGLNFAPESPRCVSPQTAAEIVQAARARFPALRLVGVFVNEDANSVRTIAANLGLDAIQLHGDEPPDYARALRGERCVIKAVRVRNPESLEVAADYPCDAILLDVWNPFHHGGTGKSFDWSLAGSFRDRTNRLILAGGLTAENVVSALATVRPFAVDVCSGVEDAPGRKNHLKLRRFIEVVRAFETKGLPE